MASSNKKKKDLSGKRNSPARKGKRLPLVAPAKSAAPNVPAAPQPGPESTRRRFLLLTAFSLSLAGLFSLPQYHILLDSGSFLARVLVHPSLLLLGFMGFVWLFRVLPEEQNQPDVPRAQAYLFFSLFSGLCFFTRFYDPGAFPPYYFVDQLIVAGDIRNIIDLKERYLILPLGSRGPFFSYLSVLFWEIFPKASGFWITRLSSAAIDLVLIWGLYLLGRSFSGRRMGLILMSFWALSMPGIFWSYSGYGSSAAILVSVWTLVFFFRLIQKPSLAHFIYLGAVMAFGDYTYAPFRPWVPVIITLVLVWILFNSKEKPKNAWVWFLACGLWVSWAFLFFYKNNYMPKGILTDLAERSWFLAAVAAALMTAYLKTWTHIEKNETNRRIFGWATGASLTAVLMAPLLLHPLYSAYTTYISVFHENGKLVMGLDVLKSLWPNIQYFLKLIFATVEPDFSNYPLPGHAYFESFTALALVIGFAYFIAKPDWRKGFLILMAVVGIIPFILCQRPHSGRLFGMVASLFLMGAWGLDVFWGLLTRGIKGSLFYNVFFVLVFTFWAWSGKSSFDLSRKHMAYRTTNDAVIGAQVYKDWNNYRVIIARHFPDFVGANFSMICDQKDASLLTDPNPIYLEPGEKSRDIALYVYCGDGATQKRIHDEFPRAQWNEVSSLNGPCFFKRVLIPIEYLQETPGKILYIQRVTRDYWRRRFYWTDYPYGFARGVVGWDEKVPFLQAAFPPLVNERATLQADGELRAPVSGKYLFSVKQSNNVIMLSIDGKKVFHELAGLSFQAKVYLTAGPHKVIYQTAFRNSFDLTEISVVPPDGSPSWVLGKPSLENKQ